MVYGRNSFTDEITMIMEHKPKELSNKKGIMSYFHN
jgi:hypothetical protein